jgi:hypothetical protein
MKTTSHRDLHSAITDDLNARLSWESRQKIWYEMRHNGLRRKSKPWPNAADLHFPLADSIINKLKPFYFQQIYSSELLAHFVPWRQQVSGLTESSAMWFDYKLRQCSNLETEVQTCIDHMLMAGLSLLKVMWDVDKGEIRFDACHPLHIITPPWTQDIQDATRIVHVIPMSVDSYKSRSGYNQDKSFVGSITGHGSEQSQLFSYEQNKNLREGLTTGSREDEVIVWEVYEKVDGAWMMHTFSPLNIEENIKPTVELSYLHGELPFIAFATEVKDKGFYSSRGIPESVAPFEASLCKMWNEKHDTMTVYNRPLFQASQEMPNTINLKFQPGQILPFGISPIAMPPPPLSFDQEMEHTQSIAEGLIAMPDFGLGPALTQRGTRTATEINALSGLMNQNVDMRARIFRLGLGRLYRQCWSLLTQYDSEDLKYYHADEVGRAAPEALHNDYVIRPSGSADGTNKPLLFQKAVARMQMFAGNAHVNQAELIRSVLEIDDPQLVSRLLVDAPAAATGANAVPSPTITTTGNTSSSGLSLPSWLSDPAMQQALENLLIEGGLKIPTSPGDHNAQHLHSTLGRLIHLGKTETKADKAVRDRYLQHILQHLAQLEKENPAAAKNWRRLFGILELQELAKARAFLAKHLAPGAVSNTPTPPVPPSSNPDSPAAASPASPENPAKP